MELNTITYFYRQS